MVMTKNFITRQKCIFKAVFFGLLCFWSKMAWPKKETITFNEEAVLTVKVKQDGPVRINVKGDRLQDVMGFDESIMIEKDESHGFLYLRNLGQEQSITLMTEGGTVQDLNLVPDAQGASVIVLASKDYEEEFSSKHMSRGFHQKGILAMHPQAVFSNSSFQDQVLALVKQLYQGDGSREGVDQLYERSTAYGLTAKPLRSLQGPGMRGAIYEITNTTETTFNLVEKDFYLVGDYALSIGKKQLESSEKTLLIVVGHG